jgi:mannose-6-phosphate isomerase-like protein (cupin superfamily)
VKTLNIRAELNGLNCTGRRPDTPEAELAGAFGRTLPYRDGFISTVKFSGKSAWEFHLEEEMLFVVEGGGTLLVIEDGGVTRPQSLHPSLVVVVPKGSWHAIEAPGSISLLTVTPQPTHHLRVDLSPWQKTGT